MGVPIASRQGFRVGLVSGKVVTVLTEDEAAWFNEARDTYLAQTRFTEHTDKQDLDRLLVHELMIYRWTHWIAAGMDYDDNLVDENALQRNIKLYSDQITRIKESMGLTKKARDDKSDKQSLGDYIVNLKARAKEFGIHREEQLDKALELLNELFTVVGAFSRSDEEEREKLGFSSEKEIVDWIRDVAEPEYRAIDEYFRKNQQRYWVKEL